MSVETYAARRHYLTSLTAKMGDGHTVAKRIAVIRSRPSLKNAVARPGVRAAAKPAPNVTVIKAKAARSRRLRLAEAEAALPAPRRKPSPIAPEACSSMTLVAAVFDPSPMNARPTRRQVVAMRRRVDAAMAAL